MKKSYLLLFILFFMFPLTIHAVTVEADGQYHRVSGAVVNFQSSDETGFCTTKDNVSISGVDVKLEKENNKGYCLVSSTVTTNIEISYGRSDFEGNPVDTHTKSIEFSKIIRKDSNEDSTETTTYTSFCKDSGVKVGFKIVGIIIMIIKIFVPIALIILGMVDMSKAVVSDKQDAVKSSAITFGKRAIAALLIFLIPTLLFNLLEILELWAGDFQEEFKPCYTCLLKPNECEGASLIKEIPKE